MGTFTAGREADWQNGMHDFWHQMEVPDPVDQEEKDLVKLHGLEIIIETTVEIIVRSHWHFKTKPHLKENHGRRQISGSCHVSIFACQVANYASLRRLRAAYAPLGAVDMSTGAVSRSGQFHAASLSAEQLAPCFGWGRCT